MSIYIYKGNPKPDKRKINCCPFYKEVRLIIIAGRNNKYSQNQAEFTKQTALSKKPKGTHLSI